MAWYNFWKEKETRIDEEIKAFQSKGEKKLTPKQIKKTTGEGIEDIHLIQGYGNVGLSSFNLFYSRFIDKRLDNEITRIKEYRSMSRMSEISDVIEDAINESTQEDEDGETLKLIIKDSELQDNTNITNNLFREFKELFYDNIDINEKLWSIFQTYFIDGRYYYERVIDESHPKKGIINIKKLPSETMDRVIDPHTGKIIRYYQYLSDRVKRPTNKDEALKANDIIVFDPHQISFVDYGVYGNSKYEIMGYLDKARIPYNQLKLLETSVVIYRIIRAPERFVFRIDTGSMPPEKSMKFVENIKMKMTKKQTYDSSSGKLTQEPEVLSLLENFYLPQSADGRGSQIDTVGGNSAGFENLDDIYYFARKLYRSLKYPISRVTAGEEKREGDLLFGGNQMAEIARDEVKWSKFLERQQRRICKDFIDLFLLHLEFKGLKEQYSLSKKSFNIVLNPPSHYKEQMQQNFLSTEFENYSLFADRKEVSKSFAMKRYLNWDDDTIKENVRGFKRDKELGLVDDESSGRW